MYTKLFKMCGWSDEEINANRNRIEYMLEKIDCADEKNLKHAEEHVSSCFDLTIPGVPQLLRVYLLEFVDSVNIRNEYDHYVAVNYPVPPGLALGFNYAQARTGKRVAVKSTTQNAIMVLGMIFDKYTRVLETGELIGQAAGKAHCAQYQAEAGLLKLGILPVPDLVVASGWFCDQAAECDEMLSEIFGFESLNLDGCMDWPWNAPPSKENMIYSAKTLKRAMDRVEEVTGLVVTDEDNAKAWEHFGNVAAGIYTLVNMVAASDPQCMSHADISLVYLHGIVCPSDVERGDAVLEAVNMVLEEANRRIEEGIGVVPAGAPKVYVGMRTGCDVRAIKVIEEAGMSITNMFIDGMARLEKEPPMFPNPDRYLQAAEFWFKRPGFNSPCYQLEYQEDMLNDYNCDGAVLSYMFNCRPWVVPVLMGRDYLEKKTGKPCLVLESDYYDTRLYSPQQQKTRLEAFAEMLKMNKELETANA